MSRIEYPDDIIRSRRQSIEVAENLEIWADEDEFILELFKSEQSVYKELDAALDAAASLILGDGPVDSVEFVQTDGIWEANMNSLRASIYIRRKR